MLPGMVIGVAPRKGKFLFMMIRCRLRFGPTEAAAPVK